MKLLAKQKNSNGFSDWYQLVFVHKDTLFFMPTDSNPESDAIINEVISIDESIDFDHFKAWIKEWTDPENYTPFHVFYGWKEEFKNLLKDYEMDNPIEANHVSG